MMHSLHRLVQVWGVNTIVLIGPVKYQTKVIYVLNIIGLFFILFLFSQNTHAPVESSPVVTLNQFLIIA